MVKVVAIAALLFIGAPCARAQTWSFNAADHLSDSLPQQHFIQFRYQTSQIADTKTDGIKPIEANPAQSFHVRYGVYGYGRKKWQEVHHHPTYGIGISKFQFSPADNIVGNPVVAYIFYNESFARFKTSSFSYDFALGLGAHWKPYDSISNPEQKVIGSRVTAMVGISFQYDFKISNRMEAAIGAGINHFSNGRIRSPNRGLNLYGLNISLRYRLQPLTSKPTILTPPDFMPFHPQIEFYTVGSGGTVTTYQDRNNKGLRFLTASFTLDVARHYSRTGKYGVGLDWSYDGSLKEAYAARYPSGNIPTTVLQWYGVHLSHEYMIHRWTLITQAGVNLNVVGDKGRGYGRIAMRYDISKHLFFRGGLRIYDTVVSDFIEWGLGYSWY